ncbi:MAG: LuxR C-terminal-related transcriptional regulator [Vicinamibacterales bacterium]
MLLADIVDVGWIRQAAAMGVDAVLSQDISSDILQRSLHLVVLGQQLFPAALAYAPAEAAAMPQSDLIPFPMPAVARPITIAPERPVVLSEREGQILRCLIDGASNKEISRLLRLNEATVKGHLKALLRKVSVSNRTQAAIWALNNNICVSMAIGEVTSLSAPATAGRGA